MSPQALHDIHRKLRILNHAKQSGNISQTCRYFGSLWKFSVMEALI